jgi:hypothetical protein
VGIVLALNESSERSRGSHYEAILEYACIVRYKVIVIRLQWQYNSTYNSILSNQTNRSDCEDSPANRYEEPREKRHLC